MNISNIIKKFPNERLISLDIETTGGKKGVNRIIQVGNFLIIFEIFILQVPSQVYKNQKLSYQI